MSKIGRGTSRSVGKKKTKRRADARPAVQVPPSGEAEQPTRPRQEPEESSETVLRFRPRGRESGGARASGRTGGVARAALQPVDYGYVYTDLRIIGVLSVLLFGGLVAISFVLR